MKPNVVGKPVSILTSGDEHPLGDRANGFLSNLFKITSQASQELPVLNYTSTAVANDSSKSRVKDIVSVLLLFIRFKVISHQNMTLNLMVVFKF